MKRELMKINKTTFKKTLKIFLVALLNLLYFLFSLSDKYHIIVLCLLAIILGTVIHYFVEFIVDYIFKNKK